MMHKRIESQHQMRQFASPNPSANSPDMRVDPNMSLKHPLHNPNAQFVASGPNMASLSMAIDINSVVNGPTNSGGNPIAQPPRNMPIKAFPTPSNAVGNILGI
jgi:hypothetical protein